MTTAHQQQQKPQQQLGGKMTTLQNKQKNNHKHVTQFDKFMNTQQGLVQYCIYFKGY